MGFSGGKASEERSGAGLPPAWDERGANKLQGEPIFITGGASSVGQFGSFVKHNCPPFVHGVVRCSLSSIHLSMYPAVIQMAKLSGFSPIITTASSQHAEYCELAGATHVLDYHTTPYSALPSAITTILSTTTTPSKPLKWTFDCIGNEQTNMLCWTVLAPSGTMIVARRALKYWPEVVEAQIEKGGEEGKNAVFSAGNVNLPINKVLGESLYARLEDMLRDGRIKVCFF